MLLMLWKQLCFGWLCIVLQQQSVATSPGEFKDYCEREFFKAKCAAADEVVVIRLARYGRMREGRCVTNAYEVLGCSQDVRDVLDLQCSGRRECDVLVANLLPENRQPCPKDFRSYLEVLYDCVKVISAKDAMCRHTRPAALVPQPLGYLSALVAEDTGCGSLDNPWTVTVAEGQRIRFTLYDFGYGGSDVGSGGGGGGGGVGTGETSSMCHVGAVIKEEALSKTVCRGTQREEIIYTSQTRTVDVRLIIQRKRTDPVTRTDGQFLIKFEAIGCMTPQAPRGGWVGRVGDKLVMGCNDTWPGVPRTWELACDENQWKGRTFNCTTYDIRLASVLGGGHDSDDSFFSQPLGISVATVTLIAFGVCFLVLIAGVVYVRRRKLLSQGQMKYMTPADAHAKEAAYREMLAATRTMGPENRSSRGQQLPSLLPAYEPPRQMSLRHQQQLQHHYASHQRAASLRQCGDSYIADGSSALTGLYGLDRQLLQQQRLHHQGQGHEVMYLPGGQPLGSPVSGGPEEHIYESPKFMRKCLSTSSTGDSRGDYYDVDHDSQFVTRS